MGRGHEVHGPPRSIFMKESFCLAEVTIPYDTHAEYKDIEYNECSDNLILLVICKGTPALYGNRVYIGCVI
jgi:hypothetical protein